MECFSSANYIQAIASARNISAAAEELGISQPALSSHLKKLEDMLGVLLFDRTKHPLELTDAGKVYLQYAMRYQALYNEFMQHVNDLESLKRGHLTIAGAGSFNISYFPKAAAAFMERYPGIDMEIIDDNIPEISLKAVNGQIDLFIAPPGKQDDRLQYEKLLDENIFLCVPPDWALNDKLKQWEIPVSWVMEKDSRLRERGDPLPQVDFGAFREYPFILLKEDQHIGRMMNSLFERYGFMPRKSTIAEQTMTSYNLTLAGIGVSLMTESTIRSSNFKEHPRLYMADREICRREIFVVYPKQKYLSKAAKEFIRILKDSLSHDKE